MNGVHETLARMTRFMGARCGHMKWELCGYGLCEWAVRVRIGRRVSEAGRRV